jgi:hypothetical protein
MCSAAINIGPELTPAQLFAEAKIRFDSAVVAATAANDPTTLNFALLGRARTSVDLATRRGDTDAARFRRRSCSTCPPTASTFDERTSRS